MTTTQGPGRRTFPGAERPLSVSAPTFAAGFLAPRFWPSWLLLGFLRLCALAPRSVSLAIGAALGRAFYTVNEKRRHIASINVSLCLPQLSEREREDMVRRHFRAYGQSVVDLGLIYWASERKLARLTRIRGLAAYRQLLDSGRSVLLITPHAVGMDLGGVMLSRLHPTVSMMKSLDNGLLNWMIWRGRTRFGSTVVMRRQGLRPLIKGMRRQMACYYVPDEDFGAEHSVFVPFFGVPTATITTVGRMAAATNAVVVPCMTRLLEGCAGYEIMLRAPMRDYPSGDRIGDAARMNEELEACVREAPEQYLWTLKWFRSRPNDEPPPY